MKLDKLGLKSLGIKKIENYENFLDRFNLTD